MRDPRLAAHRARQARGVARARRPFGTLLQIGLDWGGPERSWERDGMRLLAQDVMPKFGQHVTAQAAE
jgi:hypothetical protein